MTKSISVESDKLKKLYGSLDSNIIYIESKLNVKSVQTESGLELSGNEAEVEFAGKLINSLIRLIDDGIEIDRQIIRRSIDALKESGRPDEFFDLSSEVVAMGAKGKRITCKTIGQRKYVKAIHDNTITFGIGPAGTGKTFLAVVCAYAAFKAAAIERIVLTRPALEAGEKLGFLPGDLQMKVDPYLRPLYDALSETFGQDVYQKLMEKGAIEIAPLAYMRGRTLNNAFIILDEAQNATIEQMKMFLTRLGKNSKMIITGDITQVDLPDNRISGLKHAARLLEGIDGICVNYLTGKDVVRHELVTHIIEAYEKNTAKQRGGEASDEK